ncbi:CAMK family protein kinase [Trichomonas vaginalis G3]|uniref:CAMK family protein kinase n=1 Tax=Trichomonas vaginalis (strain ATCC PRA-98 / G3) TaxID=412133 RepID=A2FFY8_TRIV3|nr:protein serine/threonine kinase protein [Trichomonas vaginalis G3]EAX96198.1 CAMK family protein kinase [Trichomonas vaginalis G3]KAI5506292.1 protein serine/threonine kinase protein [Trichomonas vaginalis G3]|eukprot:XP_001309128.1 CAMK family protein kinase [Trichomonas vaginalis G3]
MDPKEQQFLDDNGLVFIKIIAKGTFGVIYQVYSEQFRSNFALKRIPEKLFSDQEVQCLIAIDDPKIVSLYKYYKFNGNIYLLMEFCMTDLQRILIQNPKIQTEQLRKYITDMVKCVKACHDKNIAHCDIKPANFMIDAYGRLKIGDFGLSAIYKDKPKSLDFKGSGFYMSPEIFCRRIYNPIISDMWALGVSIYFITTKRFPFEANTEREFYAKLQSGKYNTSLIQDPLLAEVIAGCLELEPRKRLTVDQLLELPYFTETSKKTEAKISLNRTMPLLRNQDIILKPKVENKNKLITFQSSTHNLFRNSSFMRLQLIDVSKSSDTFNI